MKLFEVEYGQEFHEHFWARDHQDAAQRAFELARENNQRLLTVYVSTMIEPPDWVAGDRSKGGLVYVSNDTQTFMLSAQGLARPVNGGRT
jgi:hypothetical protein